MITARVAQLIEEAERRGQAEMVACARVKAETTPAAKARPATMSNKEFRRHLKQLARQRNEEPLLVEKRPPKSERSKPTAVTEKKPPTTETRKFNVRRKAK